MVLKYESVSREQAIFAAKRLLVDTIWKIANIEIHKGITFPETAEVLSGKVPGNLEFDDALIVNNIKRAWNYLFEHIDAPISFSLISEYNKILGEGGLIESPGNLRYYSAIIGGSTYKPPMPEIDTVLETLAYLDDLEDKVEHGLSYFSEISKGQWFNDGNKRTAAMVANHYLVQQGVGILAMDVPTRSEFFDALIKYYENGDKSTYHKFLYENSFELMPSGMTPLEVGWQYDDIVKESKKKRTLDLDDEFEL
ncbi:Fic family protein [Pseudolactococcus yaeyamensis]